MMRIRERRARTAHELNAALLALLLVVVLVSGCVHEQAPSSTTTTKEQAPVTTDLTHVQEQLDAHKAAVVQLLAQNSQLREYLESSLYELNGDLLITTVPYDAPDQAVLFINGKLVIPDGYSNKAYIEQYEHQIIAVFQTFNCVSLAVHADDYGDEMQRVLGISFDDVRIDDHYYVQSIGYSRDGAIEGMERILTNWYYLAAAYT
jgi:hypothetical protein